MKKNQSWSALLISIVVTMIIIIVALYLLDKIVPFARDIKGVENGNISYYRANTALNQALLSMSGSDPSIETSANTLSYGSGMIYNITAKGKDLPENGQGNSEYDKNWNILAPGKPIQLVLKSSTAIDWTVTYLTFRVPDLNKNGLWDQSLSGTGPVINWTLSASGESLQASGSQIMADKILWSNNIKFSDNLYRDGLTLSGSSNKFSTFYTNNCTSSLTICTLKLSLINPLLLTSGESAPYLEYQAHFDTSVPLQTAVIETQGYAGGFRKNITRFIQQMTTNEALDFTVFQ